MTTKFKDFLSRFSNLRETAHGYIVRCPAHDDRESSLSISAAGDGRILVHCFAGCTPEMVLNAVGLTLSDLFPNKQIGGGSFAPQTKAQHRNGGLTLEEYAEAKRLPIEFLKSLDLSTITYQGRRALRIPYFDQTGREVATRYRLELKKQEDGTDNRFRWKNGSKPILYRTIRKFKEPFRIIVEGESDCHTLWYLGYPALGLPGAANWKEDRDAPFFEGVEEIFIIIEPDHGGEAVKKWLGKSSVRDKVKLVTLKPFKDPSDIYLSDPDTWREKFEKAFQDSVRWRDLEAEQKTKEESLAWAQCKALAVEESILKIFSETLKRLGVVGEEKIAKLLFLALVSRHLSKPVSIVVKGPSSGGKSFLVESVLEFFPPSAYYALTSMSEHALAYSEETLKNRFLVLYEVAGLNSDFGTYLLRSLLSEGCLRYETVEKTSEGMKPKLICREGPTGTIITTTAVKLHSENETRLLSVLVTDTREQTKAVLISLACGADKPIDLMEWHALQTWIDRGEHRVIIPYAETLAAKIPPLAVRLRRDFTQILSLIKANAILHQAKRVKDIDGRIIATLKDYRTVREIIVDIISEGVGSTVSKSIRETVEAVKGIISAGTEHVIVGISIGKVLLFSTHFSD